MVLLALFLTFSAFILLYVTLRNTRVLTRASVVLIKGLLSLQNVTVRGNGSAVEACEGGILINNVTIPDKMLEAAGRSCSVVIQTVSIRRFQLIWAAGNASLTLRVTGVVVRILQRRTAPKVDPNARPMQRNAGKLKALEALLWEGCQRAGVTGWRRRQLRLLRFVIGLALRNVAIIVADVDFQYRQNGDPAPVMKLSESTSAIDAVSVIIRDISVSPVTNPSSASQAAAGELSPGVTGPGLTEGQWPAASSNESSAGPSVAVRSPLYRWRDVSAIFQRIQALYNWLHRLISALQQADDSNASQIYVAGVDIALLSKASLGVRSVTTAGQQLEGRLQAGRSRQHGWQRVRGQPGRASPIFTRMQATAGRSSAPAPSVPEWEFTALVLRQWSVQVNVFVGARPKHGSNGSQRNLARAGQPLALAVHGFFGVEGQQRSSVDLASDASDGQHNSASSQRPTAGLNVQSPVDAHSGGRGLEPSASLPQTSAPGQFSSPGSGVQGASANGHDGNMHFAGFSTHVNVVLKALVLELTPQGVVQLLRMVDRVLTYDKYSVHWSQRPSVSVKQSPAAWWQHAGRSILNDRREHYPLRKMRELMVQRAEYIRVYKELRSMQRGFLPAIKLPQYENSEKYQRIVRKLMADPASAPADRTAETSMNYTARSQDQPRNIRKFDSGLLRAARADIRPCRVEYPKETVSYRTPKAQPKRHELLAEHLHRLELETSLSQIMCNRTFVALWHSRKLAVAGAREQWLEALEPITRFIDAIPNVDEDEDVESSSGNNGGSGGRRSGVPTSTPISLGIDCPRLGLKLVNKHSLDPSTSVLEGDARNVDAAPVSRTAARQPADVLAAILEGFRFYMPDIHCFSLQAATIKASLLGDASNGPKHLLVIPASRECTDQYGTKMDFSVTSSASGHRSTGLEDPLPGDAKAWGAEGSLYPDAPISWYLSRYKIQLAPVEMAFSSPPLVVACVRFLDSILQLKAAAQQANIGAPGDVQWCSTNIHSLVMESYKRNRVRLPSSMAAFMPKLQFFCPSITARWMLAPADTISIGGISARLSEVLAVAVLSNVRIASRYVYTCYASLVQATSAQAHIDVYFQLQPCADFLLPTSGSASDLPQKGLYAKMWLHPDDVELAAASESVNLGGHNSGAGSYPFLPLLKIRSCSSLTLNEVPYEPTIPGTVITHQTVGVHSAMAWFSPWHATIINAAIHTLRTHPVLLHLRNLRGPRAGTSSCMAPDDAAVTARDSIGNMPSTNRGRANGSSISVLLDAPLLTVNFYSEMPKSFGSIDDLQAKVDAMQKSGDNLQLAAWVTKRLLAGKNPGTDPGLRWGLRLAPLLTVNVSHARSGLRLTRRNNVVASLQTTGLQISDHQARLKKSLYKEVWLANSGRGSDGPAKNGVLQSLLPEDSTTQLLGPLAARAASLGAFARDRRRSALHLHSGLSVFGEERRGRVCQEWRRFIEVQLLHRASDFALFLLSPTHKSVARQQRYGPVPPPLESYRMLFQQLVKDASLGVASPLMPGLNTKTSNSLLCSSIRESTGEFAGRSPPVRTQSTPRHYRSISVLDTVAALFYGSRRAGYGANRHRKSFSLVQAFSAVNNRNLHRILTQRLSADLPGSVGPAISSGSLAQAHGTAALSAKSVGQILEDVRLGPSAAFNIDSNGPGTVRLQDSLNWAASAVSVGSRPDRQPLLGSSHTLTATAATLGQTGGTVGSGGALPFQSSFAMASDQNRTVSQSDTVGNCCSPGNDLKDKLSFMKAFQHLGNRTMADQRVACVHSIPFTNPVISVVMAGAVEDEMPLTVQASSQHLNSCVGVHSMGAILRMLVQVQQAVTSFIDADTPSAGGTRSPSGSESPLGCWRGLTIDLTVTYFKVKVVMEEVPRRVLPVPSGAPSDRAHRDSQIRRVLGLTELTAVELSELHGNLEAEGSDAQILRVAVSDLSILDLQGCVEHRNVLMGRLPCSPSVATSARQQESSRAGSPRQDNASFSAGVNPCKIELIYEFSRHLDVPAILHVRVNNPCITWLRRYSNNLLYAAGVIGKAYNSAMDQGPAATIIKAPSVDAAPVQPLHGQQQVTESSAGAVAPRAMSPVLVITASNTRIVLPGGAAARHGPIRRAVHNEAITLEMQSVTVCIPCSVAGLHSLQLFEPRLHGGADWMTHADEVNGLIGSSLRLGNKHFPQINQQASPEDTMKVRTAGDDGNGGITVPRCQRPAETSSARASSPSNRLQRRLQAAKAAFIDPLKEILQEASQKRTKQRGELGFVLVDEGPGGPIEENPGYVRVPENEIQPSKARPTAANTEAAQHTTTTVHAAVARNAVVDRFGAPQSGSGAAAQQLLGSAAISLVNPAGRSAAAWSSQQTTLGSQSHAAHCSTTESNNYPPTVLISIDGFSAASGTIVRYDDKAYRHRRPVPKRRMAQIDQTVGLQQQPSQPEIGIQSTASPMQQSTAELMLPPDLCNAVLYREGTCDVALYKLECDGQQRTRNADKEDDELDRALNLLADTELHSVHQLIGPVHMKGVVFHHQERDAMQLHLSAVGAMVATLGPQRYERLIKVLTDNITEAYNSFNVGEFHTASTVPRRTTFAPEAAFAPRPGQLPYFHLTVEWPDQLRVELESDPAWWKPDKEPAVDVKPCLQGCFTHCSLGLIMTQTTHDMFLAFFSQQLHVADVRIGGRDGILDVHAMSAADSFNKNGGASNVHSTAEHALADSSRRYSGDGAFSKTSCAAGTCDEDGAYIYEDMDGVSMETPDFCNVQPLVDDQLRDTFPGMSAVVTLLRSNIDLPADEAAHLASDCTISENSNGLGGACPRDPLHDCVRISFSMLQDGTMANEIELCHTLVQWPYLTEMSLVSSIIAIFLPAWGHPTAEPELLLKLAATPWHYFNLLLRNSQLYIPVLAPHLRRLTYGWRAAAAEAAGEDVQLSPLHLQKLFASMVEDAAAVSPAVTAPVQGEFHSADVKQPSSPALLDAYDSAAQVELHGSRPALSPLENPVISGNWAALSMRHMAGLAPYQKPPKRLEQMGVVLTMAALRIGYFAGGDGDSVLKVDLRNAAGFVRHNDAQVTNWLLPIRNLMVEQFCSMPLVEESSALQAYIFTSRVMMRRCMQNWLRRKHSKLGNSIVQQQQQSAFPEGITRQRTDKISFASGTALHEYDGVSVPGTGVGDDVKSVRSRTLAGTRATTVQDFLLEQATNHAAELLELHKLSLPLSSATGVSMEKLVLRQMAVKKLALKLDTAVFRASFSNIPLWHSIMDDMSLAMKFVQQSNGIFAPAPAIIREPVAIELALSSESIAQAKASWNFRANIMSVDANIKSLGVVLCDDKPKSYGAPDILTAALEQVSVQYSTEKRYYDHAPEQSGSISLRLGAQFLNNSTGRWEHLLESWPAEIHLSDPINPIFKSSRTKYMFVSSSELMKLTFHPSCLLTLGDTLSFVRRLSDRHEGTATALGRPHNEISAPVAEDPPSVSEQMALSGSIMARVPQRYLIQNLTGLVISYWAPKAESDVQPASSKRVLPPGCSEELQVTPTAKQVKIVGPGGIVVTRLQAQVIVLSFEGAWMPISDVSVDVVGKYCYDLHSPIDDCHAPVIVDVALVGRTKILKIHSALYVQNGTSLRLSFRLYFPSVVLARQVAQGTGDVRLPGGQDIKLKALKPGEGRYLPVVAALGGALYLEARAPTQKGWCSYEASKHDVIRLFPNVHDMLSQAGFIASGPPAEGQRGLYMQSPLHFAVKVRVKTRTEYSYITFNSMEVPGPGLFAKASRPLEASIKICPTVVLTNTLPYHMEGYLISFNVAGRDFDSGYTNSAGAQMPSITPFSSVLPTNDGGSCSGGMASVDSRRPMRIRRSDVALDEIPETEHDRIVSLFKRLLLPLLNQKARGNFDSRAKELGKCTPNEKKCFLLSLLRHELRWAAKRNAKEMELLIRTDSEPPDKISWQDLEDFIEWAQKGIRLVHVQPGEAQRLYLDMRKQLVMSIKVPERNLVCTRPVEINYGVDTGSNAEAELPDFMRLDHIDDMGKGLNSVWEDMKERNKLDTAKPLLKVVNQQVRETAAAVGDKVVNTVRGVRDAALDVFSGPQNSKSVQPCAPTGSVMPLESESATYWQSNPERVVRLQLLVQPGAWQGSEPDAARRQSQETHGGIPVSENDADGHRLSVATHQSMLPASCEGTQEPCATALEASPANKVPAEPEASRIAYNADLPSFPTGMLEPAAGVRDGGSADDLRPASPGGSPYNPASSSATPLSKIACCAEKGNASTLHIESAPISGIVSPVINSQEPTSNSPDGATILDAHSSSAALRYVLNRLRPSMRIRRTDVKGASSGGKGSPACPHPQILDGHVRVRFRYRPGEGQSQTPTRSTSSERDIVAVSETPECGPRESAKEAIIEDVLNAKPQTASIPSFGAPGRQSLGDHAMLQPAGRVEVASLSLDGARVPLNFASIGDMRASTEISGSPCTPRNNLQSNVKQQPRYSPSADDAAPAEASPGSIVVHHSGPVSLICVPSESPQGQQADISPRIGLNMDQHMLTEAKKPSVPHGGLEGCCKTLDITRQQGPLGVIDAAGGRPDAMWTENAAFKCGSSVSTTSGSDLPTRALPSEFRTPHDSSNLSGTVARQSQDAALAVAGGSSINAPSPDDQTTAVGAPSSMSFVFNSPFTALAEGYAHLEMFQAFKGSPTTHASRLGRRSSKLSNSPSLRRAPSKLSRSAGSGGVLLDAGSGSGAPVIGGLSPPDYAHGTQTVRQSGESTLGEVHAASLPANDLSKSACLPFGRAADISGNTQNALNRLGDGNFTAIREAAVSSANGTMETISGLMPSPSNAPTLRDQHGRRLAANDVAGNSFQLDGFMGSGELDLFSYDAMEDVLKQDVLPHGGRKSHSDKRIGDREYGLRSRGIGKKGQLQPSYRYFSVRNRRFATGPISLAKSAMQAVPRLPTLARNVGGKFVDGGQHVIQGVPQVASYVADTIIAGGQGVKDKVVEGTELAIKAAKPKIQKGLMAIAWKATEAMRKRKQGSDDGPVYQELRSPRRTKRKEGDRAPKVLLLSLHNSLAHKEDELVCRISLYAAYWVDNRTGFNLLFKDLDAPAGIDNLPFLLWHPVQAPGNKADASGFDYSGELHGSTSANGTPRLDRSSAARGLFPPQRGSQAKLLHKLALLNDQTRTRFRVIHPNCSETGFCDAFTVATINQKYSVDIKGEKSVANAVRIETTSSRRLSAQNSLSILASVHDGDEHQQPEGEEPKERSSGRELNSQSSGLKHVPSLSQQLCPNQEESSAYMQALQLHVHSPTGDVESSSWQQLSIQNQGRGSDAAVSSEDRELVRDGCGDMTALSVQSQSTPAEGAGASVSAAALGRGMQPKEVLYLQPMLEGAVLARRPLEPVTEITSAEDEEGRDVLEASALGRPLGTVAVCLSEEIPRATDDTRPSAAAASHGRQSSSSAGRRGAIPLSMGIGCRSMETPANGQGSQHENQMVPVRRLYQFAVEVWAAPSDTVFGRTKIITVKNKYSILNATGLAIEYKQKGTPDPGLYPVKDTGYGKGMRFSRVLQNNARAAWHWDNAYAEQELMIRPADDEWEWSGSFELPEFEDYFGLRIRRRSRNDYIIIPVNISVGPAGSVLVTLKSKGSVPPYMIINRCRDVIIYLKQVNCGRRVANMDGEREDWDEIHPSSNPMPFAWDEPRKPHVVKVMAASQRGASPDKNNAIEVNLDAVNANTTIYVQSRSMHALPLAAQLDARERAKFLTDNAKKVYVTVYADGPTRVLCFSEDRSGVAYMDDENSLLNLCYRLQRVSVRLKEADQSLAQQLGGSLDLNQTFGQDCGFPGNDSSTPPDENRFFMATRLGSAGASRGAVAGTLTGRQEALHLHGPTSSGAATPPSSRMGAAGMANQVGQSSFAFQRIPSLNQRPGSASSMSMAPGSHRHPSLPGTAPVIFNPPLQRVQPNRSPPNQGHMARVAKAPSPKEALAANMDSTTFSDDRSSQFLEALPAPVYRGYVDLPMGGDLTVILRSVDDLSAGLNSNEKVVAVEAQMMVLSSNPGLEGNVDQQRVTASWTQAADPAGGSAGTDGNGAGGVLGPAGSNTGLPGHFTLQDHTETFRDISASAELQIDFYIAKGTEQQHGGLLGSLLASAKGQSAIQSSNSGHNQAPVKATQSHHSTGGTSAGPRLAVSSGQFAGSVRVPLMSTITCEETQIWRLPLERKAGSQLIRGYVTLSFKWSVTKEGILVREISTLERILDEKLELLAQLNPMPASATKAFVQDLAVLNASISQDAVEAVASFATVNGGIDVGQLGLGTDGTTSVASMARPLSAKRTAKALAESYFVNLELSVLEISGLLPREGLRASIAASLYGRPTANMMSVAMLPRAVVSLTCVGETRTVAAGKNSVNPRFQKNTITFENVPLGTKVALKVLDQVSASYQKVLAEAEMHLARIPGTDPIYAWLALARRKQGSRSQRVLALLMVMEEEGDADVQLLMRIKINKPQVHGVGLAVTLDLAGVGLCAKTNLEELFNYTMQKFRASLVRTGTELQVSLAVQTIQLDNQMLEAKNPVVLSPADITGSSSLAQARRRHKQRLAQRIGHMNPVLRMGTQDTAPRDPLIIFQVIYNQASSNHGMLNSNEDKIGILAFKKVILDLGPLDFSADQEFIEGVVAYLNGIPMEDFYQDRTWQEKIDAMQGGSMAPVGAAEDLALSPRQNKQNSDALAWLAMKEAKELELLRGQSSTWFYLEEFYLSDVFINVTLALSSSFNAVGSAFSSISSSGKGEDRQRSMVRGFLTRVSGNNGFQLINVTNAPIQLEYVELRNHLVNRVSLINKLYRHYSWIALAQARKVLGGAGPAIAAIPASLLWASLALFDLGQDVAAKRVNPVVVPTRIGYVVFTLMGQVIGVLSRTMCAIMGLLPPRFSADTVNLSDSETARRFGIKPQTVMDALYLSQRDAVLGLMSGAFGLVHDTAAGGRWKGGLVALGVPMGLLKASVGLGVRPAAGAVEATSKLFQGIGLLCRGKRGIQGKLVRRIQAPGVAVTDVVREARASAAQAAMQATLIAAWQVALPAISSALADDIVADVVAARSTRVVLLTNRHLAYLYARRHAASFSSSASPSSASRNLSPGAYAVTYKVKWMIRNDHIDNVRGLDRSFAVSVEYHKPVKLGRLSLKLPLHKGMRTTTAEGHKDLIFRLNRHIGRISNNREFGSPIVAVDEDGSSSTGYSVQKLSIMGVAGEGA